MATNHNDKSKYALKIARRAAYARKLGVADAPYPVLRAEEQAQRCSLASANHAREVDETPEVNQSDGALLAEMQALQEKLRPWDL